MKKENWFKKIWQLIVGGVVLISGIAALSGLTILVGVGFVAWWFIARAVKKKKQAASATYETRNLQTYEATGMRHYLDNLLSLAEENEDYNLGKSELVRDEQIDQHIWKYEFYPTKTELVPEPDNPHDPNAIKVVVDGVHVGYIKRESCAHLLELMNAGRLGHIRCEIGGGPYKMVYEDYEDDDWSADPKAVYTLEKDKVEYFVHLRVEEL